MIFFADKGRRILVSSIALVVLVLFGICAVYLGDYYRADTDAIEAFSLEHPAEYKTLENDLIVFEPEGAAAGLIFYPGGKVEYSAYLPLMEACASKGILCVLVKMPFNLAVFDVNAADGIPEMYPEVEDWYLGGHSLGGSMAASYLSDNTDFFEGLILLGSYSTADLSQTGLDVLSLYGSEDLVLNREKYQENKSNLPGDLTETVLPGGCHAFFGMYGPQDGDGSPAMTNEEQIRLTADAIAKLIEE